jgi:putative acetyltransferase
MIQVRPEQPEDALSVYSVNQLAFGQPTEAVLVDTLRTACPEALSLVAVMDDQVVGHILFTPVTIPDAKQEIQGMGLAPMAVLPDFQRQGIGSQLVRSGLEILRRGTLPFVIVLGHPEYYPRFGFVPASRHGLVCQWPGVPDEAFMVFIFDKWVMSKISGMVMYREEFNEAV